MTDPRQRIPAVHQIVADAESEGMLDQLPRALAVDLVRQMVDEARVAGGSPPDAGWLPTLRNKLMASTMPTLKPVINATGVILHTNLGRAPLARAAVDAIARTAAYASLEYDLASGDRGSRRVHVRDLLRELTGAEDALVVTNAAAALVLILNTVARDGETLVSRGELVEIGGAFRIPDILKKSGTTLVEVGTTNRTRTRDYEAGLSPRSRCVLKVHRSNFTISGFTSEASLDELATLSAPRGLPLIHDAGSGLLIDLAPYGLEGEPLIEESARTGAVVTFSGDKLVGGPQAGLIVGPADIIGRAAANPLARAMRPDKLVLAGVEATLNLYRDPRRAVKEIPVLAMLTAAPDGLRERAAWLASRIDGSSLEAGTSSPGGGSFPGCELPTTLVTVNTEHPDALLSALREADPPVIGRSGEGRIMLDARTIADNEMATVADLVNRVRPAGAKP